MDSEATTRLDQLIHSDFYRHSSWGIAVADLASGEVLYDLNGDQLFIPGSTTKLWSCAAALDAFGAGYRFVTPIYRRGELNSDGRLDGELILRASGDPNLSGRTDGDGHLPFTNHDHTYADVFAAELTDSDPFQGIDDLARQVAACGIRQVRDIIVDDRLFDRESGEHPDSLRSSPVMVNDNVIDLIVTPGDDSGQLAKLEQRPETAFAQFDLQVETVGKDETSQVMVERAALNRFAITGQIALGSRPVVKVAWIEQPQDFLRALLIERLARLGVWVERSRLYTNHAAGLPPVDGYKELPVVAEHVSPPFAETVRLVLKVSHNPIADILPQLIASRKGQRTREAGLRLEGEFLERIGIEPGTAAFSSGAGGGVVDRSAPKAALKLLRVMASHPDAGAYRQALPILGVDGTLWDAVEPGSPAKGKVAAKTGTYVMGNGLDGSWMLMGKALAGYLTARSGRELVLALYLNMVRCKDFDTVMAQGQVLGKICEIFYDAF